jgi:hypothetical protein
MLSRGRSRQISTVKRLRPGQVPFSIFRPVRFTRSSRRSMPTEYSSPQKMLRTGCKAPGPNEATDTHVRLHTGRAKNDTRPLAASCRNSPKNAASASADSTPARVMEADAFPGAIPRRFLTSEITPRRYDSHPLNLIRHNPQRNEER